MKFVKLSSILVLGCLVASTVLAQGSAPVSSAPASVKEANRALAKSVRKAIGRVQGLDATRVYVKARGGVVTLSGTLRSQVQIDSAGKAAQGVDGVSSVNNQITIFNEGGN